MFRTTKNFFSKKLIQHKLVKQAETYTFASKEINLDPMVYNSNKNINDIFNNKYDAVIVGAGHNGLVCANYLAKAGKNVLVLEKRHTVGGCAVTEEIVEGYKFSRCSYVLALFRKGIIDDLFADDFHKRVKLHLRNPRGMTPTREDGVYLVRRAERDLLKKEIAKFSVRDAENIDKLDSFLERMVKVVDPLLDIQPPTGFDLMNKDFRDTLLHMFKHRNDLFEFYNFITSAASTILDKYLESDILKATFATDAVIGAMNSPYSTGSAYVLLHHVMGNLDKDGSWYYVEGGNGALSKYIADKAVERGVDILLNAPVDKLLVEKKSIVGVNALNKNIQSPKIITNCDLNNTYFKLLDDNERSHLLDSETIKSLNKIEYNSPVMKINLAVDKLPQFKCLNSLIKGDYGEQYNTEIAQNYLTGTIHMNCENMNDIDYAYREALSGKTSTKPIIEMTIPSILDKTLVPHSSGHHVIGLFIQYAPYKLNIGTWNIARKKDFAKKVYEEIDKYAPGFSKSIIYDDILSPADLEKEFSITGGNIFHGAMDLSTIFFCRPFLGYSNYKHKINGLYSCSSGMHPGGGVMGAVGRNCAKVVLKDQ
jgi:phytoene dehydrogenase-like protein